MTDLAKRWIKCFSKIMLTKSQFNSKAPSYRNACKPKSTFLFRFPSQILLLEQGRGSFISLDHRINLLEKLQLSVIRTKPKLLFWPITTDIKCVTNQSKVEANTYNWRHWLKKWREFCHPTIKRIKVDIMTKMTFDTQFKSTPLLT